MLKFGDINVLEMCSECLCPLWNKPLCLSFQSKKHANKVRRYLSIQNEKEPALKKLKPLTSDSVSKK